MRLFLIWNPFFTWRTQGCWWDRRGDADRSAAPPARFRSASQLRGGRLLHPDSISQLAMQLYWKLKDDIYYINAKFSCQYSYLGSGQPVSCILAIFSTLVVLGLWCDVAERKISCPKPFGQLKFPGILSYLFHGTHHISSVAHLWRETNLLGNVFQIWSCCIWSCCLCSM